MLILVGGTLLLYTRSLGYDFINYDDPLYITNNMRVQAGLTWDGVVWAFTGKSDYWHPLTWISHMLDWQLFGAKATGHRAVNVLWHAANAGLVFMVMRRLSLGWWMALFSAALFAWHPLRVESVVWVTERKDVMSGFFFLLTLLAYTRYAEKLKGGQPARGAYATTLALFLGGLMCKPSLVTLPLVLLALDFWPFGRLSLVSTADWWKKSQCAVLEKIPFLILSGAVAVATIVMQHGLGAFVLKLSLTDRLGNAIVSIVRYLGKFFWPVDLVICYPHPGAWPGLIVAGAVALIAAITWATWRRRIARPWLLTGWVWFVAMLLPSLGLIQVGFQAMADRFTYVAILGAQIAILMTCSPIKWPAGLMRGIAGLILIGCAAGSWHQQQYWSDSVSLYRHALAVDERNQFVQAFLGYTHMELGEREEAERHASRALELAPDNQWALIALATVQGQTGRLADGVETYRRLLTVNPRYASGHYQRALWLIQLGRPEEADENFKQALQLAPDDIPLWQSWAEVLARRRQFAEAATAYEHLLALNPDHAEAHAGLGYMLALTGRKPEAARHWQEALRLKPDFPGLRERLRQIQP